MDGWVGGWVLDLHAVRLNIMWPRSKAGGDKSA